MSADAERFRALLERERERVAAAIENLHQETPGSIEDETDEPPFDDHIGDVATVTYDREMSYSLEESAENLLAEIDQALGRIEKGSFGRCTRCGKPIAEERLEAIPYATLCIDCKRKDEGR